MVLLQEVAGNSPGRKIQLRGGQKAVIGRTERSDFSCPLDHAMDAEHFRIDCSGGTCSLQSVGLSGTLLNGDSTNDAILKTGDTIQAGGTTFSVIVEGSVVDVGNVEAADPVVGEGVEKMPLAALCAYLEFEPNVTNMASTLEDDESLIAQLTTQGEHHPAIRLRSHTLGNRKSVWWSCLFLRELQPQLGFSDNDLLALSTAEQWVQDENEASRNAADQAAKKTGPSGPCGLTALAAFCSGGSIGHPEMEPVEPDERMCGTTVAGALIMVGYTDAEQADARIQRIMQIGKELHDGIIEVPESSPIA